MDAMFFIVLGATLVSFLLTLAFGRFVIPMLRALHAGQSIREVGPQWHNSKAGTPTMGGIMFIAAILLCTVGFGWKSMVENADYTHLYVLGLALCYGLVGFADDFVKVKLKRNLGLTASQKFLLQLVVAVIFLFVLKKSGDLLYRAQVPERLWTLIQRDGISLTGAPGRDSLGQHDYTWGAGWMYDVNGYYPGKGLSEWMLGDGDVLTLRFTLAWGKDIDGFGATGGGYGVLSSYCYVWRDGQEIPLGHDWQETARVEPTETEDGYADYVCTKCAETRRDVLPKTGTVDPTDPTDPTEPPTAPTDPTENGNERSMFLEANAKYSDPAAVRCTAGGLRRKIGACKGTRGLPGAARRARGLSGGPRSGAGGQLHRRLARHGAAGLRCEREL